MTNNNLSFIDHLQELKHKNVVPKSFSNDLECIMYIMYFIHPHLDDIFSKMTPNQVFDKFYDLSLRSKQFICHTIKKEVNDGNVQDLLGYLKIICYS